MRFGFVVRSGIAAGRTLSLASGQVMTFGRLSSCEVQLDDESVSRRHCTVQGYDHACTVVDLHSVNGTFVNEGRVASADLRPGDKLRIGGTIFELVSVEDEPQLPAALSSFRIIAEEPRKTVIRRAVDPAKPPFLERASDGDEQAALAAAQRYVATLHQVSAQLSCASSTEALFDSILSAILEVTGGERAAILIRDRDTSNVTPVAACTTGGAAEEMVLSHTVVNDVLDHGISTFSHDALSDSRYSGGESVVRLGIRSVMCAPLRTTDEILGVLYVDSQSTSTFDETELELLAAIGNHAGVALHRARLLTEVERLFVDFTKAIAAIIDAKDGYTHRHSERVALFAVRLARQLGLSSARGNSVELAALMHDVGKIGVPDAILNKPEKLSPSEYAEVKRHPVHGAAILSNIHSGRVVEVVPGVKHHHERWDGSGYPDGLKGEAIPLAARIVAVADFIDATTSDRTYRPASPLDEAIELAKGLSGKAFDPAVVDALLILHEKGELSLPPEPGPALR